MKNTVTTNELIYFTGKKDGNIDFSGSESSLSVKERFDFLKHYEKEARKWYNDASLDKKAVSENEIEEALKNYSISMPSVRKVISFDTMTAFTARKKEEYKNFQLYCGGKIENGEIIMADRKITTL